MTKRLHFLNENLNQYLIIVLSQNLLLYCIITIIPLWGNKLHNKYSYIQVPMDHLTFCTRSFLLIVTHLLRRSLNRSIIFCCSSICRRNSQFVCTKHSNSIPSNTHTSIDVNEQTQWSIQNSYHQFMPPCKHGTATSIAVNVYSQYSGSLMQNRRKRRRAFS